MAKVRSSNTDTAKAQVPKAPLLPAKTESQQGTNFLRLVPYITGTLRVGDRVGTWVYDVLTVSNGATTGYTHPLGRVPNGFFVLNANANLNFWITDADLATFTATTAQWHGSAAGKVRGFWV